MRSLVVVSLAALALAFPTDSPVDMTGLNRLKNSTISGRAIFPSNGIRGVNLGAWFVFEPYMAIDRWHDMGGDWLCGDCTNCVNDEFSLTRKLGQAQANSVFANHWNTWITQDDVNQIKQLGLNSVRIPIGFWIIESTVNGDEFYPRGGLNYLRQGCKRFRDAGINVLLDLHAAPGAQVARNAFAGRCVATPGFWNQGNFDRMNRAAAELTRIIHNEPANFGSVWGLQALNEPPNNGNESPGYYQFMQGFVAGVRGVESQLGVAEANRLSTVFMDVSWQWQNPAGNPAFIQNGGNAYDSHIYYSFGAPCGNWGCVSNQLSSHVAFACQGGGGRIANDRDQFNTPSFLGEWWLLPLSGTFSNWDQGAVRRFGDAQKRGYSPEGGQGGFGWYFWSWKMTNSDSDGTNHMRSYKDAVAQGYMTSNAASYFDSGVCN
ncbi:glycoside hydrolase [Auricularia subglabra TFB-10046 SS5]|uniref:glucan 1,3-beta-glucosidase n=1 Tax=Auricularia subglabra (strain TFB-10046 / SS5) TaxID=717982 RepID=J0WUY6_AURST|nr:glycoside hydrolase [Auricularia subglabra TFB-10046 SS5]